MIDKETLCAPIYKKNLIDSEDVLQSYREKCDELVEKNDEGWGYSWAGFCGSWNSNFLTKNLLVESNIFADLLDPILQCTQEYIEEIGVSSDYLIDLGESWLNSTSKYGFQEYHKHTPSTVSGCIYFSSPKDHGEFYFKNPFTYDAHYELDIFRDKKFIDLNAGDIILFPSHLEHGVKQNLRDKNRYSLCFNFECSKKE